MEAVRCICGQTLLFKSECDFDDINTDTWTFHLSVDCHDPLNDCCKRRIIQGVDNTLAGVTHLKSICSVDRNFVVNIQVPEEMEEE